MKYSFFNLCTYNVGLMRLIIALWSPQGVPQAPLHTQGCKREANAEELSWPLREVNQVLSSNFKRVYLVFIGYLKNDCLYYMKEVGGMKCVKCKLLHPLIQE